MGNSQAKQIRKEMIKNHPLTATVPEGTTYYLKKRRPGCTGMFWRQDPTKQTLLASNKHWPRDGAMLKGEVVEVDGEKWLLCSHVCQRKDTWVQAPAGAAMPFEYNNHYYLDDTPE